MKPKETSGGGHLNFLANALAGHNNDGNAEVSATHNMAGPQAQWQTVMPLRQRAQSSAADFVMKSYTKSVQKEEVPGRSSFDALVRNLIDDKYNREYKLDKKTRAKALEILDDYYAKHEDEATNKDDLVLHTTVRAAILISSKCQVFQTEDGTRVRGCGLSTSTFLRGRPQIQIEEFQRKLQAVRLEANLEKLAIQECVKVQNKLGLNLTFNEKFTALWKGLEIRDKSLQVSAETPIKKLAWLIFILAKQKILNGGEDISEMAYLLYACLYWVIMLCPSDVHCEMIERLKTEQQNQWSSTITDRLAQLDQAARNHLTLALKAQTSTSQTDVMIGYVRDMLLKMKIKARLQCFSALDDVFEGEIGGTDTLPRHLPLTYEGICDGNSIQGDPHCLDRPSKCLHGMFDQSNLNKNIRHVDQYYAQQMNTEADFDERFFINHNGLQHTPIKLISPISYCSNTPVALQQNSSTSGHKSPLTKGSLGVMVQQNLQAFKRPRGESIPLKFIEPNDIPFQGDCEPENKEPTRDSGDAFFPDSGASNVVMAGKPMQRRLQFNTSLNEISIRETLNQQPFPISMMAHQADNFDKNFNNGSNQGPSNPLQTPIGQMMQLKNWVENLQQQAVLDPETGFLASLPNYVTAPADLNDDEKKAYFVQRGIQIREMIFNQLIKKLLHKLYHKRVIERPNDLLNDFVKKHSEPIFRIYCCILDTILAKELRRQRMANKPMPDLVQNETIQKSYLIYATVIHLYSKNINDLFVQEMLEELKHPAFDLWFTFVSFIQVDPFLPQQLREHFLDIERQLTLHLVWQMDTLIVKRLKDVITCNQEEEKKAEVMDGKPGESMAEMYKRNQAKEKALSSLRQFFNRVKEICANTIQEMCEQLKISEECRELIWNIMLVTLGLKSNLLFGRHIDQLIMCAIYSVCKIHAGSKVIPVLRGKQIGTGNGPNNNIKFVDIIDSYKEIHKRRLQNSGRWQINISQSNSVSWVYIEVALNPEEESVKKVDIIQFYNDVYIEKMKQYILKTKTLQLDAGSKTPVLNQSNFNALLTPGGRPFKPVINQFTKLTPLIDSLGKNKRFSQQTYMNQPGGGHWVSNAGVLATSAIGQIMHRGLPSMTPRTNALYASNERQYNTEVPLNHENPINMAKNYSQIPVYKLAAQQLSGSAAGRNNQQPDGMAATQGESQHVSGQKLTMSQFMSLNKSRDRPPQPTFAASKMPPQNLRQLKAPPTIAERPAFEEQDPVVQGISGGPMKPSFLQAAMGTGASKKLSGSIVGQSFSQQPSSPSNFMNQKMNIAEEGQTSMPVDAARLQRNESVMFINPDDVGLEKDSDQRKE